MKLLSTYIIPISGLSVGHAQFSFGPEFFYGLSKYEIPREAPREGQSYINEYRPSFATGAFAEFRFTKWFSVQIDFMFNRLQSFEGFYIREDTSMAQFQFEPDEGNPVIRYKHELTKKANNFTVPLTLQFNSKCIDLNIGTQFSILTGGIECHYTINKGFPGTETNSERDVSDIARFDIAFTASLSYKIFGNLSLEARLNHGLKNLTLYPPEYNFNV